MNAYNLPNLPLLEKDIELCGRWDMPVLRPCDAVPDDLIDFGLVKSARNIDRRRLGVHFFTDDYWFERVWRHPKAYVRMLMPFRCVFAPDFSLYSDMPLAQQVHNVYRSRLMGAWWQSQGMNVVPTLQWSTPKSFSFAFDGLPRGSVVAASTLGVLNDPVATALWRIGMREALKRLAPELVLLYGMPAPGFDWQGTEWIRYRNHIVEKMESWEAVDQVQAPQGA